MTFIIIVHRRVKILLRNNPLPPFWVTLPSLKIPDRPPPPLSPHSRNLQLSGENSQFQVTLNFTAESNLAHKAQP